VLVSWQRCRWFGATNVTFTYDANGSQVTQVFPNEPSRTDTFTWDLRGRMSGATIGGTTTSYGYSSQGHRVKQTTGSTVTTQLYDPLNPTGYAKPIEESTTQGAGSVLTSYLLGDGVDVQANSVDGVLVFVTDASGRTRALTDMTRAVVESQNYDAHGNALDGLSLQTSKTTWHMPDGKQDRITGLTYHLVRDLDRTNAHWTSQDPSIFGAGNTLDGNLYSYVNGNPMWGTDPSGLLVDAPSVLVASTVSTIVNTALVVLVVALVAVHLVRLFPYRPPVDVDPDAPTDPRRPRDESRIKFWKAPAKTYGCCPARS
jgi:RHS repeat-associated protein